MTPSRPHRRQHAASERAEPLRRGRRSLEPLTDRHQSLVDAAREIIAERGFEGLRTREVAERVGINHATLHHYFATKEALIDAVVRDLVSHLLTYRTAQASDDLPALAALRAYFAAARQGVASDPAPFIVLGEFFLRAGRNPKLATIMRQLETGWTGFFVALLERGQQEGTFRRDLDPATVARILVTYLGGVRPPLRDDGAALAREHAQLEAWITGSGPSVKSRRRR